MFFQPHGVLEVERALDGCEIREKIEWRLTFLRLQTQGLGLYPSETYGSDRSTASRRRLLFPVDTDAYGLPLNEWK
jgi:hypothetical protein